MNSDTLVHFTSQALQLVFYLSLPVIAVAAVAGIAVGLMQALTQVQDQTFAFVVKLVAVIVTIIFLGGWVGAELHRYAISIFEAVATVRP